MSQISDCFEKVCELIRVKNDTGYGISSPQAKELDEALKGFMSALAAAKAFPPDWTSRYSIGKGNLASVVWVVFLPPGQTTQDGIYVSFCFGKGGNGLVCGCAISNTSRKKYKSVRTVSRQSPIIDVDGTRPGTHYNDGYVNPREFLSGELSETELLQHVQLSVPKVLNTIANFEKVEDAHGKDIESMSKSAEERYKVWNDFLKRWPAANLSQMTIDQYTTFGGTDSFCNWVESRTETLGSIWGGSAYKFGVFRQNPGATQVADATHDGDGTYKWYRCYGQSAAEVFAYVKDTLAKISSWAAAANFKAIDSLKFGHAMAWKIAFLYQNIDRPSLLPIYNKKMLSTLSGLGMNAPTSEMQRKLMSEKPQGRNLFDYYEELLKRLPKNAEKSAADDDEVAEEAMVFKKHVKDLAAEDLTEFLRFLENEKRLKYSEPFVRRFIAAVQAKNFVVLTGLSGSGKTQLAIAFCEWISGARIQDNPFCRLVAVGADWTNNEKMVGYVDAMHEGKYVPPETGILQLILSAAGKKDVPHFLVLDEMNLSHVERYFADFLSAMESGDAIRLHGGNGAIDGVPPSVVIPENLWVLGTMNVDETTYMFSPKVLDRAQVIEFRVSEKDMRDYLGDGPADQALLEFFPALADLGAEFGYRTAKEFKSYVDAATKLGAPVDEAIDSAIMQKLLPKVHGARKLLAPVLKAMWTLCLNDEMRKDGDACKLENAVRNDSPAHYSFATMTRYPMSAQKIFRMYLNADANGFASYAEA